MLRRFHLALFALLTAEAALQQHLKGTIVMFRVRRLLFWTGPCRALPRTCSPATRTRAPGPERRGRALGSRLLR